MGHGEFAETADKAMEIFIRREFPEVLTIRTGKEHSVKFIPDSFIHGKVAEKVGSISVAS